MGTAMNGTWIKRALLAGLALLVAAGFYYALAPKPVLVDTGTIARAPMRVTVDEEGETRIREIYVVSAPIGGKVLRSPREVGDVAEKNKTLVAVIQPEAPSFLDIRRRRELEAAVAAAKASIVLTESEIRRARSELEFARSDLKRTQSLAERGTVSQRTLEKATLEAQVREAELAQAEANLDLRKRELESAKARLIGPEQSSVHDTGASCCVEVYAPENGRVLKIYHESEQIVQSGAPLLEIGDPHDLEIVVDLLSTDMVKVKPGAEAHIEGWGGPGILNAHVRRIDPAGFTKVSALGIEEQRVNAILDLTDPKEKWAALGHDFRVFARITVWQSDDTLTVPLSALFRHGQDWAVFKVEDGQARLVKVEIGERNTERAQLLSGLAEGDRVIVHPSDRVSDGVSVEERENGAAS
jgi:HlyD family secretion protein